MSYDRRGLPRATSIGIDALAQPISQHTYDANRLETHRAIGGRGSAEPVAQLSQHYDRRLRPTGQALERGASYLEPATADDELSAVSFPFHYSLHWDAVNNLYSTIDYALGSEWPLGQQPRRTNVFHDALYRVAGAEYEYRQDDGSWNARSGPITDWRDEQQFHESADPMGRRPAPMVSELPAERPMSLVYSYDWLANMTEWTDDANAFHERSLSEDIGNGANEAGLRPGALYFAGNTGGPPGARGGWVSLTYGESGNVSTVTVRGQCIDNPATPEACVDPGTGTFDARDGHLQDHCQCAVYQHYQYRWDELNRLSEARRYDGAFTPPSIDPDGDATVAWTLQVQQRYRYDGANVRMVKETTDDFGPGSGPTTRAALYVYPGDFERRGVQSDGLSWERVLGHAAPESQYLVAGTRLVWKPESATGMPGDDGFEPSARLTYAATDLLQSTTAVLDLFSGELLERGTFLPNGARETLRSRRVDGEEFALEPMGFTGKEGDSEVGLVYFGERYLMPHLGRWASADPLQVHSGGGGELGNSYQYVAGSLLQSRDPVGLDIQASVNEEFSDSYNTRPVDMQSETERNDAYALAGAMQYGVLLEGEKLALAREAEGDLAGANQARARARAEADAIHVSATGEIIVDQIYSNSNIGGNFYRRFLAMSQDTRTYAVGFGSASNEEAIGNTHTGEYDDPNGTIAITIDRSRAVAERSQMSHWRGRGSVAMWAEVVVHEMVIHAGRIALGMAFTHDEKSQHALQGDDEDRIAHSGYANASDDEAHYVGWVFGIPESRGSHRGSNDLGNLGMYRFDHQSVRGRFGHRSFRVTEREFTTYHRVLHIVDRFLEGQD